MIVNLLYILLKLLIPVLITSHQSSDKGAVILSVDSALINYETVDSVINGEYIQLKASVENRVDYEVDDQPDLIFSLEALPEGRYVMDSYVDRPEITPGSVENLYLLMQVGNNRITRRIVSDARDYHHHVLGDFYISNHDTILKIWLPKGILFKKIEVKEYSPVKVPSAVRIFNPPIVPPKDHPRLWVTKESLQQIKSWLTHEENIDAWNSVKESAIEKYIFDFSPDREIFFSTELEKAVESKAFYYLITGDKSIGREAIDILSNYLSVLEYGNVKYGDITRNIGHSIYVSAIVFDWCNDLLTENQKSCLYDRMINLAEKMEIGWPPFKECIVNGHAAEAQVNRDLLAMSIAIYDLNPLPYKYTSYLILENLVPMRDFEYQSPRHNQGVDYGAYRHMWEMNAAWLFYRMSGKKIFNENIERLPLYWLYMRLPNGFMFRDGDIFRSFARHKSSYWKQPEMLLLDYSYSRCAILKNEFIRQGGLLNNPILYLLLNDPSIKIDKDYDELPTALETGSILGSVISRTGWNMGESSNDVVAEIKGGGYIFGNHQHADAGSFQLYYHGLQICNLGLYIAYGSNYDYNYNKRSLSRSMMLVVDPEESFGKNLINDGGVKFNNLYPKSPGEVQENEWFDNGTVISSYVENRNDIFEYSYFFADLTNAYSSKISDYKKSFCFVNTNRDDTPAFIVIADNVTSSNADFKKYWQITTLNTPEVSDCHIMLHNRDEAGIEGKTYINMLLPEYEDREVIFWNSRDSASLFSQPIVKTTEKESDGYHLVLTPVNPEKNSRFLNVLVMTTEDSNPPSPVFFEKAGRYHINLLNYLIIMPSGSECFDDAFEFDVPDIDACKVIILGLKTGWWTLESSSGDTKEYDILYKQNSLLYEGENCSVKMRLKR